MKRSLFLIAALAACSSSKSKPTTPAEPAAAGAAIHRFQIGAFEAVALQDGAIAMPNDGKSLFPDHTTDLGDLLAAAGLEREQIHLSIQPLLVKTPDHVLLFDTGAGGVFPGTGELPASLALAGVAPADVTDIFISHGHGDHMGGLVVKGALAFPSATIHISAPEWASVQAEEKAEDKAMVAVITPKVDAFEPGAQILPEVAAVATQGHTPGHSSYVITSGDDSLFYLGDVAHHSIISVQRPAWSINFDTDKPAAEAVRAQTLAKLAADHTRVYAVHFPFPGLGHIADQTGTLVWQPE